MIKFSVSIDMPPLATINAKRIFIPLTIILILWSCTKDKKSVQSENQGKNYDNLLKTITTDKASGVQRTVRYNYSAGGRVSNITTETVGASGTTSTAENFFRNNAGQLDSVGWQEITNGAMTATSAIYFSYNSGGQLITSRDVTENSLFDSSVYLYSGNTLMQRLDYRNTSTNSLNLFLQVDYTFDANGNLTQGIFQQFGSFAHTDTISFHYDDKTNPVPGGPNVFYLYPIYYNDYRSNNNLTRFFSPDVESYDYSGYTYSPNNKPLYRKETPIGDTRFAETYYYYD